MGGGLGSTKRHGSGARTVGVAHGHFSLVSRETRDVECFGSATWKEQGERAVWGKRVWGRGIG